MKVVISVRPMHSGSSTRGIGAYTRELVHALTARFPADSYIPTSRDFYTLGADVVHYPFFDPFFLTLPWMHSIPTVVTIHDLIPLKYPKHFPAGIKGVIKWNIQKNIVKRVNHILTDSMASKKDIENILGISPDKVTVVPLAAAGDELVPSLIPVVKKEYGLPGKYILYVGDINWNKNVPGLVRAFGQAHLPDTHLLLVGKAFVSAGSIPEMKALRKAMKDSGKEDLIHTIGYVPSHHLPVIYSCAELYVQPSWDEGFGLPLLEAMKAGCPVVASDRGSLPEVGGDAVVYCDPESTMKDTIERVMSSPDIRRKLVRNGKKRVKSFTWEKAAEETRKVYEKVMGRV